MRTAATSETVAQETTIPSNEIDRTSRWVELQCPRCDGDFEGYVCRRCGFQMRSIEGILHALPPERVAYHARFVDDYERVVCSGNSGRPSDEFYLGLPYGIACSRSSADWRLRARSFDCLLGRVLKPAVPADARILDLGAGNCWLSYRLALAGYSPCAVDLLTNDQHGLGAAEHYRKYVPEFFPRFRAEMARLPFQDGQFHAAIFNASLHYAENWEFVLQEALRCCKPGGIIVICDTPVYPFAEDGRHSAAEMPACQGGLTTGSLKAAESRLNIRWTVHTPQHGLRWKLQSVIGQFRDRLQRAQCCIYAARRAS